MLISSLKSNTGECPYWGVSVSVLGLYKQLESGAWTFTHAECPIIQNSKLPPYEQEDRYKYMFCKNPSACPLYTEFQPSITSDM